MNRRAKFDAAGTCFKSVDVDVKNVLLNANAPSQFYTIYDYEKTKSCTFKDIKIT